MLSVLFFMREGLEAQKREMIFTEGKQAADRWNRPQIHPADLQRLCSSIHPAAYYLTLDPTQSCKLH